MKASQVVVAQEKTRSFQALFRPQKSCKRPDRDYPLPNMETIFHELEGSKFFVKINISSANYQILLDEAARDIFVVNTTPVSSQTTLRTEKRIRKVPANNRDYSQRIVWNYLF